MRDESAEIPFQSFLLETIVSMSRDVHSLTLSIQHFVFCGPRASPTLQGALIDAFEEAVVARGMLESCEFPSLDSCQKRFLWAYKEVV